MARDLFQEAGISLSDEQPERDLFAEAGIEYKRPWIDVVSGGVSAVIDDVKSGLAQRKKRELEELEARSNEAARIEREAQQRSGSSGELRAMADADTARQTYDNSAAQMAQRGVDFGRDTGLGAVKGTANLAVKLPLAVQGIALDATGTRDAAESIGLRNRDALQGVDEFGRTLDSMKSDAGKERDRIFESTKGFTDTLLTLGSHPAMLSDKIAESLVGTAATGVGASLVVKQFMPRLIAQAEAAGLVGDAATKFIADKAAKIAIGSAAAGEGVQGGLDLAGTAQGKGRTLDQYGLPALASAVGTAGISLASGGLSRKLGIGDVETDIALRNVRGAGGKTDAGFIGNRIAVEGFKEGVLEEMPQSSHEAAMENIAMGRPWDQGLGKAAATGLATGFGMGGGHAAITRENQSNADGGLSQDSTAPGATPGPTAGDVLGTPEQNPTAANVSGVTGGAQQAAQPTIAAIDAQIEATDPNDIAAIDALLAQRDRISESATNPPVVNESFTTAPPAQKTPQSPSLEAVNQELIDLYAAEQADLDARIAKLPRLSDGTMVVEGRPLSSIPSGQISQRHAEASTPEARHVIATEMQRRGLEVPALPPISGPVAQPITEQATPLPEAGANRPVTQPEALPVAPEVKVGTDAAAQPDDQPAINVRTSPRKTPKADTLIQAIINRGGISRSIMGDVGADPKGRYAPGLFTTNGTTDLSLLGEYLANEDGFDIPESTIGRSRELEDRLSRALGGERILNADAAVREQEASDKAKHKQDVLQLADEYGVPRSNNPRDIDKLDAKVEAAIIAEISKAGAITADTRAEAIAAGIPETEVAAIEDAIADEFGGGNMPRDYMVKMWRKITNTLKEKMNDRKRSIAKNEGAVADQNQSQAVAGAGAQTSGQDARPRESSPPALELTSQTESEAQAEQDRLDAIKEEEASAKREAEAKARKEQAAKDREDIQNRLANQPFEFGVGTKEAKTVQRDLLSASSSNDAEKKVSGGETAATDEMAALKSEMGDAIGELASILGVKMNLTPEEESKIIPVVSKIFRIAAKMGYVKFKDAARYVMQQIRSLAGDTVADKIEIENLQAGYINIAKEIGGDKREAMAYDSIDEIMENGNEPDQRSSTNLERDSQDAKAQDSMGEEGVRAGRDGDGGTGRSGVQGTQEDSGAGSSGSLFGPETVVAGERSDLEIYAGASGSESVSTGSRVDSGSDRVGVDGPPIEPEAADFVGELAESGLSLEQAKQEQEKADKAEHHAGLKNVRETLPILTEGQQEDVFKAETRFAVSDGYGMLFTNGTGTGKAQPLDAKILTPSGWKRMGDMRFGDEVIAGDGSITVVTGVFPQGEKPIYRVEFSDGAATECCDEHLWLTQTLYARRKARANTEWNCAQPQVRQLSEIRASLDDQHFIPVVGEIETHGEPLPIPAYTLGVILGDGCLRGGAITFSSQDSELAEFIAADLPHGFAVVPVTVQDGRCPSWRISSDAERLENGQFPSHPMADSLRALGLFGADSFSKFIPESYLFASRDDRVALLRGLMDTDGTVDHRTGSVSFSSVSPQLRDGVIALVRSLGGIATYTQKTPTYTHNGEKRIGQVAYTVCIHIGNAISLFALPRKQNLVTPKLHAPRRKIVGVVEVGTKQAQCISVAHPSRLYVTDDYIVTHNTFTGLGVIKRHVTAGKSNIIVAVPNDKIAEDWQKSGTLLGLNITRLADTNDAGRGVVITTYANFGQNPALASRDWDLVVHDEAHYLAMDKDGTSTLALGALKAISLHPEGALNRAKMLYADQYAEMARLSADAKMDRMSDDERNWTRANATQAKADAIAKDLREKEKAIKEYVAEKQGTSRPRVLFLSATPFAYEKTVDWANGYLFDYNEGRGNENNEFRGYNTGSNRDQFFMQHFGYRMRYGKLTQPDAKVDSGLMQRQFNTWLKKKGSLSGRMLDVKADYDRRFVLVESAIGSRIDEALQWFEKKRKDGDDSMSLGVLRDAINEKFDYLSRRYILEAIKANEVIPHIREHLALGRKVVVFHDYKKGGGFNPFDVSPIEGNDEFNQTLDEFKAEFKDLIANPLFHASSPIDTFRREFPGVLLFNGDVSAKDRRANVAKFQDDASGPQVMLVQSAAGKEGISLHDTTGKHQRVLFNLGQPTQPTTAIQQEGRIYRTGQVTDAIFRYLNTGTNWEKWAFATTIAQRASAAENLGMGEQARALKDAFISGFEESGDYRAGMEDEGKGGKERDKAANAALTEYDRARAFYFGTQKKTNKTKAQEGADYFATPEPVGLKMVEFANIRPGESVLEPSAGHGAIARWIPDTAEKTAIEPSMALRPRLAMVFDGKILDTDFESHNIVNKYDAIVLNPPFGSGGKTAIEHLAKAAKHLRDGGRVVALIPRGPAADKKFDKWFYEEDTKPAKPLGKVTIDGVETPIYRGDTLVVSQFGPEHSFVVAHIDGPVSGPQYGRSAGTDKYSGINLVAVKSIKPTGKRTETFKPAEGLSLVADIVMPQVTFERAGTQVATRIVVIEKGGYSGHQYSPSYADITNINELFDRMENLTLPERTKPVEEVKETDTPKTAKAKQEAAREAAIANEEKAKEAGAVVEDSSQATFKLNDDGKKIITNAPTMEYTTKAGKKLTGVLIPDKSMAKAVDAYSWATRDWGGKFFVRIEHIERPGVPMFSRGTGRGMALSGLQAVVDRVSAGLKNLPRVHVLSSPSDLSTTDPAQKALRDFIRKSDAWIDVEGATHEGEIYLFASGMADEARAEHVLATHEVTHYGLRGTMGKDLDKALQHILLMNAKVRKAAVQMKAARGLKSNIEAIEEVLADIPTADLAKLRGWRKVVQAVRNWLHKAGAKALAKQLDAWLQSGLSDQEKADLFVADLVGAARQWAKSGKNVSSGIMGGTRLAEQKLSEDWAEQEKWLAHEAKARGFKSIDDLAEKAYPVFEKLAALWRKKHPADVLLSRKIGADGAAFNPVDVASSAFRRWFGDWGAALPEYRYQSSSATPVPTKYVGDLKDVRSTALNDYHSLRKANPNGLLTPALDGKTQHGERGRVLLESNEKFASKTGDKRKFQIVGKLPELLKNATWYGFEKPKKPSQAGNVAGYHYLMSKANIDGIVFDVAFAVREDNNGNFHHNHTLYRESEAQESWVALEESSQLAEPSAIASDDLSLYRPRPKINLDGISKVVDAEGRPLMVYHGTSDDFTGFKNKYADRVWEMFSDSSEYSNRFASNRGGRLVPVYLRLLNPLDLRSLPAIRGDVRNKLIPLLQDAGIKFSADFKMADLPHERDLFQIINMAGHKSGFANAVIAAGYDGIVMPDNHDGDYLDDGGIIATTYIAISSPTQIKSAISNTGEFSDENHDIRFSRAVSPSPTSPIPASQNLNPWQKAKAKAAALLTPERLDKIIYEMQDKYIDLRRLRDHIKAIGGTITDLNDAYLGEEMYHKRVAKRTQDFLEKELKPLLADMRWRAVGLKEMETFLHARHAPEANAAMAKRNPTQAEINAGQKLAADELKALALQLQSAQAKGTATKSIENALNEARGKLSDWNGAQAFRGTEAERLSLSGMSDNEAKAFMDGLPPAKRSHMDALAAKVDAINAGTLDSLEKYGLMDKAALDAWRTAYQHYVPLHRDEAHPDSTSHPIGQGFSTKGDAAKRRTGSNAKVTNILGHIAMQRESALTRGEKNHVMRRLYLMAKQNPLTDVWSTDKVPTSETIDKKTGFVQTVIDPLYKNRPNILMLRIAGKDVAIVMNESNPNALRMAQALKNLDVDDLHYIIPFVGKFTRYFASINTQYNPIFGIINFIRDIQAAALQLSTTELIGSEREVMKDTLAIMGQIIKNKGRLPKTGKYAALWEDLQNVGGTTGYRDLYLNPEDRANSLLKELKALDRGKAMQAAHAVADWLSDYNEAMENAVRLAAYQAALNKGLSKERAASVAKNVTVNFNRKGRQSRELGALYAFFNAAVQGTTRMAQTLAGPRGKQIMAGGVLLGAISAIAGIAMMGGEGDDDEYSKIPEFVRERSMIIPIGDKSYIAIPMPLGFHFLPNIGRLAVEMFHYRDKTAGKQLASLFTIMADAFNPLGGGAPIGQIVAPTVADPFVALMQNKDWTGKPIYLENRNALDPEPGHKRTKDTATAWSKAFSDAINSITGGTQYTPGAWSPTPDQIDFVIGQLTGGVGRELGKVSQSIQSVVTGDELPPHKIPLAGRLYGTTDGVAGQSGKFYENIKLANEAENEIKGRIKDGLPVDDYFKENPTALELVGRGNFAEKQMRMFRERGTRTGITREEKRAITDEKSSAMREFNKSVEKLSAAQIAKKVGVSEALQKRMAGP